MYEKDKLIRAQEIIGDLIEGKNPFTGEELENESIMNEVKMIRFLHFLSGVVQENLNRGSSSKKGKAPFEITPEQLKEVILPEGEVGINDFCRCVNEVIDKERMKNISGTVESMSRLYTMRQTKDFSWKT